MARRRVDASLDAFDALIADLADAGEIAPSEVTALRDQSEIPQTREIPIQVMNRWAAVSVPVVDAAPVAAPVPPEEAPAPVAAPQASVQPMTRREARALREAQEQLAAATRLPDAPAPEAPELDPHAIVEEAVEAENARRTEDLIHSHRVRPLGFEPKLAAPAPIAAAPKRTRRSVRRTLAAGVGAVVLIPSLWLVVPATADTTPGPATVDSHGHTAQQILQIADNVSSPTISSNGYAATAIAAIVSKEGGAAAGDAAPAIVDALTAGGSRAKIVETALSYIGTPYVLGGSSHTGIDCSGLTMEAYAAIGINLAHYVPTQDAGGTRVTQAEALPGDLVVFDNEDHVGIYLGENQVIAAPAPGRRVSIESVDVWRPVGIHFTRLLSGQQ
jgi:cell wall-associated NlpC family hydrolase